MSFLLDQEDIEPPLFYKRFFKDVSANEINNWHWQFRNCIRTPQELAKFINISVAETEAFNPHKKNILPFSITPHYMRLVSPDNPNQPIRRSVIPTQHEFNCSPGEQTDPLCEDYSSPVPNIVHRYPDRVLFLVTTICSVYCRYCTRSRIVGTHGKLPSNQKYWEEALQYIRQNPHIRDVLISGGDPLMMEDDKIEWLLKRLRQIPSVEIIRIGTKAPVTLPQRITAPLCKMLKKYHPLFISIHFTHPDELIAETTDVCCKLADAGIPLGSQTVLLAGINDNVQTMKKLMQDLLKIRVKPYYIFQCDPIPGSKHFRVPVQKGLDIISGLRGHTSGYAVPVYVIDAPGGGGKISLQPENLISRNGDSVILKNYENKLFCYPDLPITDK